MGLRFLRGRIGCMMSLLGFEDGTLGGGGEGVFRGYHFVERGAAALLCPSLMYKVDRYPILEKVTRHSRSQGHMSRQVVNSSTTSPRPRVMTQ